MIRSESEYKSALKQYRMEEIEAQRQREALRSMELPPDQVETAMQPLLAFHAQLGDEISWYEDVRKSNFEPAYRLADMGRLLIGLRIAGGLSQRQLADRLCVSEAAVSRDERNEYHGVTIERAQRVLDALGATVTTKVEPLVAAA